jgi:hypothetical protein
VDGVGDCSTVLAVSGSDDNEREEEEAELGHGEYDICGCMSWTRKGKYIGCVWQCGTPIALHTTTA